MSLNPFFNPELMSIAFEKVPKTVKIRKRLKKVKKKFLEMRDISTSPCEVMPCRSESPRQNFFRIYWHISRESSLHIYRYGTAIFSNDMRSVGRTD